MPEASASYDEVSFHVAQRSASAPPALALAAYPAAGRGVYPGRFPPQHETRIAAGPSGRADHGQRRKPGRKGIAPWR